MPKETIVSLMVTFPDNNDARVTKAVLLKVLEPKADSELAEVLEDYLKPVEVKHLQFGVFVLERSLDWFMGQSSWLGESISLSIECDEALNPDLGFKIFDLLHKDAARWQAHALNFLTDEYLDIWNEHWREGDEVEMTRETFQKSLIFEHILVREDGRIEYFFKDGDDTFFGGHSLMAIGTVEGGFSEANLAG